MLEFSVNRLADIVNCNKQPLTHPSERESMTITPVRRNRTTSKTGSTYRIVTAQSIVKTTLSDVNEGVEKLYEQIKLHEITPATEYARMKLLYADLFNLKVELYREVTGSAYGARNGNEKALKLRKFHEELTVTLQPLYFANCARMSDGRPASTRHTEDLKEMQKQVRLLEYAFYRKTWRIENMYLLRELFEKVLAWCDVNTQKVNRQSHFEALNRHIQTGSQYTKPAKAVLVLLEEDHTGAGEILGSDLDIQRIEPIHNSMMFVLLPETVVAYMNEKQDEDLTLVNFDVLQRTQNVLHTAMKLYTENPTVKFERYVEVAEHLLK